MSMLKTVRNALATTIQNAVEGARVVPYEPRAIDIPTTGVFIYIKPDTGTYLEPWLSFDPQQWAHIRYAVTICVPDDDPQRAADILDDLIDPTVSGANVFTAIYNTPKLGITAFVVDAQAELGPVQAAQRMVQGQSDLTFWELTFPVQVVCQTPTT